MKKKIALIGNPSEIDKHLELIRLNFKGHEIEIVDIDSADVIINVDKPQHEIIDFLICPKIPSIAFDSGEKRKGHHRPYKYHK